MIIFDTFYISFMSKKRTDSDVKWNLISISALCSTLNLHSSYDLH